MKKLTLVSILFFTYSFSIAQKYTISRGKEGGINNISSFGIKFGEDDKYFYLYDFEGKKEDTKYTVVKIDKTSMKKEWSTDAKFSDFKYEIPITYVTGLFMPVFTEKKIMLFVKYFDKGKQEAQLYVKILTLDGRTEKNWYQLNAMHSDSWGINGRQFYYVKSPDKTKLLVVSEFQWPKKPQEVSAQLYSATTMEKIGNEIVLPDGYKAGGIRSESYRLDDAGNFSYLFYYLAQATDESVSLGIGIYSQGSKSPKIVELPMEQGKELSNYTVTATKEGKLMYSGFFKDAQVKHSKKDCRAGIYNYLIDMNGTLAASDVQYFPDDVDEKLHYKDGLVEAPTGKKYFAIKSVTELDGSYYFFANHNYSISSNNSTTTIEREFVVTKIDSKGKIQWIKVYPKYTRDRLNSYNMMVHNHKIYVFYLEHPKNIENANLQEYDAKRYHDIKDYHGSVMVAMELNADGSASRKTIEETEDWFYDPSGVNTLLEKENGLLLRMINGKKERFDVLTID